MSVPLTATTLPVARWSTPTRFAFRFSAAYVAFYLVPVFPQSLVNWVAARTFGRVPQTAITGSGDRTVDWATACCVLMAAAAATFVWSVLDRKRENYDRLLPWLRLWVRFALGNVMVGYGVMKVIPLQMPAPHLARLIEPFGSFSPMGVLWAFIGASPAYERFAGSIELIAGVFLFVPQTALLGAVLAFAVTSHIFVLNMTYDVPVKLYSFHLMLMALLVLAPDARRLINVLLLNRAAAPAPQPLFGRTPRRRRLWLSAQVIVGVVIVVGSLISARQAWKTRGDGAPRSPLYGIWNVEEMSIDGVTRPPLTKDDERWRRVIFDRPGSVTFARADDTMTIRNAAVDETSQSITLVGTVNRAPQDRLTFRRPTPDDLEMDGSMGGRTISMRLRRFDTGIPLKTRGFHWIQESPFNR